MKPKTIYEAFDGSCFQTERECEDYENTIVSRDNIFNDIIFYGSKIDEDSSTEEYLENFQFSNGRPFYQIPKSINDIASHLLNCNIIKIVSEKALDFIMEYIPENFDVQIDGLSVGLSFWSDNEDCWVNIDSLIEEHKETIERLEKLRNTFNEEDFIQVN